MLENTYPSQVFSCEFENTFFTELRWLLLNLAKQIFKDKLNKDIGQQILTHHR